MSRSTHDKQLERGRARRAQERQDKKRATVLVVALVAVLVAGAVGLGAVLLSRGGDDVAAIDPVEGSTAATSSATEAADGTGVDATATADPCPAAEGEVPAAPTLPYDSQPTVDLGDAETVEVTMVTTCGTIVMQLDAAGAPNTVANFVALAEDGYYEGVGFHRVIQDFMIQGGDPSGTGTGCADAACENRFPGYQFADELELATEVVSESGGYPRGTVAMANAGPDTNGSQFFIVQADPSYPLPAAYAIFGTVLDGMDVVDQIVVGPAAGDAAVDPVRIISMTVVR